MVTNLIALTTKQYKARCEVGWPGKFISQPNRGLGTLLAGKLAGRLAA